MEPQPLPEINLKNQQAFRLVNSKFPPIDLFDDVASLEEFDAVYAIQSLTNPRLQNEVGNLNLLPKEEIPFKITGCSYTVSAFTHVNPDGSRFSDGSFGALYLADSIKTAIEETKYHQEKYFQNIEGLHYDSVIMRGLKFVFSGTLVDLCLVENEGLYDSENYTIPRVLGIQCKKDLKEGLQYNSVRNTGAVCWVLFTPVNVKSAIQTTHFEFTYDGTCISSVRAISDILTTVSF